MSDFYSESRTRELHRAIERAKLRWLDDRERALDMSAPVVELPVSTSLLALERRHAVAVCLDGSSRAADLFGRTALTNLLHAVGLPNTNHALVFASATPDGGYLTRVYPSEPFVRARYKAFVVYLVDDGEQSQ